MRTGIVVFAHGSSVASANEACEAVARQMAAAGGYDDVVTAFLDCAEPTLEQAVAQLAARGVRRILVVPYFLTLGIHLKRDLPGIVERLTGIHEGVEIRVTEPLDGHPALAEILLDRARAGLARFS